MAVTLIAVVVALVLGHHGAVAGRGGAPLRLVRALAALARRTQFPEGSFWRGRWGIALALLPPVLAVGLFQLALRRAAVRPGRAASSPSLVLFYAWGPRDLDLDVDAIVDAPDPPRVAPRRGAGCGRTAHAFVSMARRWSKRCSATRCGAGSACCSGSCCSARSARCCIASRRWPPKAGSRARCRTRPRSGARKLLAILDWPVAQLMTLSLALVGNFDTVLGAWREAGGASFQLDHAFPRRRRARQRAQRAGRRSGRLCRRTGRTGRRRRGRLPPPPSANRGRAAGTARRDEPGLAQPAGVAGGAGAVRDRRLRGVRGRFTYRSRRTPTSRSAHNDPPGASHANPGRLRSTPNTHQHARSTQRPLNSTRRDARGQARRCTSPLRQPSPPAAAGSARISGFIASARGRSTCTSACRARVMPQPGQYSPVSMWNRHDGNRLPAAFGSNVRSSQTPSASTASAVAAVAARAGRDDIAVLRECHGCTAAASARRSSPCTVVATGEAHADAQQQAEDAQAGRDPAPQLGVLRGLLGTGAVACRQLAVDLRGEHDRDDARNRADDAAQAQRGDGDQDRPDQVVGNRTVGRGRGRRRRG